MENNLEYEERIIEKMKNIKYIRIHSYMRKMQINA